MPLARQIAHVAHAGLDDVVVAQIFVDRLRLGRRFDDDQIFPLLLPFPLFRRRYRDLGPIG